MSAKEHGTVTSTADHVTSTADHVTSTADQLEGDELFKEIGGELDSANFDYSQWQRRTNRLAKKPISASKGTRARSARGFSAKRATLPALHSDILVGRRTSKAVLVSDKKCHQRYKVVTTIGQGDCGKRRDERIKILELKLCAKHHSMEEHRKRQTQLIDDNLRLRDVISRDECESHNEVKKLLRKYEKFRGGIAVLNEQFQKDLLNTTLNVQEAKSKSHCEFTELQKEVNKTDVDLRGRQAELQTLLNYKDKEYPVTFLQRTELQKDIARLKLQYEEDEQELQRVVDAEIALFHKDQSNTLQTVADQQKQSVVNMMHPSLRDMARQNKIMMREVELQKVAKHELERTLEGLKTEVDALKKDPKTNVREYMFPELFRKREKCTPDMDIVLEIPTQDWLPI